jgi:hypothetical protein
VPVGGLAARRLLRITNLAACIGERFEYGDAVAIPLPHPSGRSRWLNDPANRPILEHAVELIHAELVAIARAPDPNRAAASLRRKGLREGQS